jgi:serine/threonine-protein kinase HipA
MRSPAFNSRQVAFEVWLPGQRVGWLERASTGLTRFTPDGTWQAEGQHPRLGLDFLRTPGPHATGSGHLPPWFENLLPEEDSALRHRLARLHGLRETDSLGLLSVLGSDLPGAVDVRPVTTHSTPNSMPETLRPTQTEDSPPIRLRFSLAGMQLKLSMGAQGSRFVLPGRSGTGDHYIVKLPGQEYPDLPEVEATTMLWAKLTGHEVPENLVIDTERIVGLPSDWPLYSPRAYAIRRFDRRPDGTRLHHEDFCQALGEWPRGKYGGGQSHWTFDKLLLLVAEAAGESEARRFAERLGFVIACGNNDAHLKNWSFVWGAADRPILSPCYDLVATVAWASFGWRRRAGYRGPELALALGKVRPFAQLDRDALLRHQERSEQPWAREAIMAGIERARAAWSSVQADAPPSMREALHQHWRFVPVLRDAGGLGKMT